MARIELRHNTGCSLTIEAEEIRLKHLHTVIEDGELNYVSHPNNWVAFEGNFFVPHGLAWRNEREQSVRLRFRYLPPDGSVETEEIVFNDAIFNLCETRNRRGSYRKYKILGLGKHHV